MTDALKNSERQLGGIGHFISRAAEIYPARIAIDDLLNKRTLTYKNLDSRINQLARALRRLGIKRGDFIAVMMWNEHAIIEVVFACGRIGAIVAPLNVRLISSEIGDYCNEHGCVAIVASSDFTERFVSTSATVGIAYGADITGWLDYETLLDGEDAGPLPVSTLFDDPYRLVMTGGTTGPSKGVLHSQGGTIITVLADIVEYGIGRGWQTVTILPAYHVAGMEWGMFTVLWRAGTIIFLSQKSFNASDYLKEVRARGIEYLPMVPAVINSLYEAGDGVPLLAPRTIVTTAAPTLKPLREKLVEMFPEANLLAAAGLSESLNMAAQAPGEYLTHPSSIGEPHVDTRLLILDDEDRRVPAGERGHIAVRNFNTALGYHRNSEDSAVAWRQLADDPEGLHWCFTGDIGVMDGEGKVSIVDRSKDVIITGGETVPSVEVEALYAMHPDLEESSVVGIEDEKWGEVIVLVAVAAKANIDEAALAKSLFEFGRGRLTAYKLPKRIAFVRSLPRTHFGKVLKRVLRKQVFERQFYAP